MSRRLFPVAAVCVAAAVLAAVLTPSPAGAAVKLRYRQESGAVPHADADVLKVFLTNTSDKPATAVVIVHKLGAQHQLDASPLAQRIELTPRQEASVTKTLDPGTFEISEHAIEVLSSDAGVLVTTQLLRGGDEIPGRNLTYADFLRTKGSFADPTQ